MSIEQAAAELAEQVVTGIGHTAILMLRSNEGTSVFVSETGEQMLATVASALDENPELISLFIGALRMVRHGGNNRNDPGFAPVIFAGEGTLQ